MLDLVDLVGAVFVVRSNVVDEGRSAGVGVGETDVTGNVQHDCLDVDDVVVTAVVSDARREVDTNDVVELTSHGTVLEVLSFRDLVDIYTVSVFSRLVDLVAVDDAVSANTTREAGVLGAQNSSSIFRIVAHAIRYVIVVRTHRVDTDLTAIVGRSVCLRYA